MDYLFVFGNASFLAEEELAAVLPTLEIKNDSFNLLGGVVKVAQIFSEPIESMLCKGKAPGERIIFGLSGQGSLRDCKEIKEDLEDKGFKVRFVLPKFGENELSSVVVTKQKIDEIYVLDGLTAKTIWVQDFEDWGKRDYGRPQAQGHIGMLPPKVARMMVNIGLQGKGNSEKSNSTMLDPFCGVGTIIAEGLMVGAKVIGSDGDPLQVQRTQKNLDWLANEYSVSSSKFKVFKEDARMVSTKVPAGSIDAIVTEPDLGPNVPYTRTPADRVNARLQELYLACLQDWQKVLTPGGRIVMVLPSQEGQNSSVNSVIDKAKIMGYSLVAGAFPYFRPQAIVRRNICIFKKIGQ